MAVTLCTQGTSSPGAGGALGSSLYDEVPLLIALRNHPGVEVIEGALIEAVEPHGDGLVARLRVQPQPIDPARCTACGKCVPVCPVDLPRRRAPGPPRGDVAARRSRPAGRADREGRARALPDGLPDRRERAGVCRADREGRHREALALVRERNPLPGVCGRVCTHPCEAACRRGEVDDPVAICRLKRYAADLELAEKTPFAWPRLPSSAPNGSPSSAPGPPGSRPRTTCAASATA